MDLLKTLKATTIMSAAALFALGATQAHAAVNTAELGHISASVQGTLEIQEVSAIRFGNFSTDCAPCVAGASTITLTPQGDRTTTGTNFTLLNGGVAGITDHFEVGAQGPGLFNITAVNAGITEVYVSFANAQGAIMDANHPNNYATITDTTTSFNVDSFTVELDDATATGPDNSGYTDIAANPTTDVYGTKVACTTSCAIRVGATLRTQAAAYAPGRYTGTYYVMVSY